MLFQLNPFPLYSASPPISPALGEGAFASSLPPCKGTQGLTCGAHPPLTLMLLPFLLWLDRSSLSLVSVSS